MESKVVVVRVGDGGKVEVSANKLDKNQTKSNLSIFNFIIIISQRRRCDKMQTQRAERPLFWRATRRSRMETNRSGGYIFLRFFCIPARDPGAAAIGSRDSAATLAMPISTKDLLGWALRLWLASLLHSLRCRCTDDDMQASLYANWVCPHLHIIQRAAIVSLR